MRINHCQNIYHRKTRKFLRCRWKYTNKEKLLINLKAKLGLLRGRRVPHWVLILPVRLNIVTAMRLTK